MDKDCFTGAGIPLMEFQTTSSAMAGLWNGPNCPSDLGFLNPSNSSFDHFQNNFEPCFNSMVSSSPAANEAFFLRELIGKLGCGGARNVTGESNFRVGLAPAEVQFPIVADQINPNLRNSASLPPPPPPLPAISADPGFIERAAKFSCFGSRSFNGRTSPVKNGSTTPPLMNDSKLPRVSSSPGLKPNNGSLPLRNRNSNETKPGNKSVPDKKLSGSGANSNEESSVSEQTFSNNSRKRKGPSISASRGKAKEEGTTTIPVKGEDEGNGKHSKARGAEGGETCSNVEEKEKQEKGGADNKKAAEAPKDYIHVRARRGQATDSHSLAERVRREKISERMKLLQDLVPGCNKVTGKALMLDEIINYVQSLQRQVEFLSMKLASVNPALEFNIETLLSKDMIQQSTGLPQQMYSAPEIQLFQQNVQPQMHDTARPPADPIHFPPVDGFTENFPQFPGFNEDDLHSIVQMGSVQNNPPNFPVSNMKIER